MDLNDGNETVEKVVICVKFHNRKLKSLNCLATSGIMFANLRVQDPNRQMAFLPGRIAYEAIHVHSNSSNSKY